MPNNAFLTDQRLGLGGDRIAKFPQNPPLAGSPQDLTGTADSFQDTTADRMTIGGVFTATGVLFSLLLGAAVIGWNTVEVSAGVITSIPGWTMGAVAVGVGLLMMGYVMPRFIKLIGPAYAVVEGLVIGAFAHIYNVQFEGIALQAVMITLAVFGVMLALFRFRIITVTDRLRRVIVTATLAVMAVYMVQFVAHLAGFGLTVPYLHDSGPIGILISLGLVGLAAFNYLLDFDFVERGVKAGAPKDAEWVAAFGLLVTTVWLFFEILRLLAKLRD